MKMSKQDFNCSAQSGDVALVVDAVDSGGHPHIIISNIAANTEIQYYNQFRQQQHNQQQKLTP